MFFVYFFVYLPNLDFLKYKINIVLIFENKYIDIRLYSSFGKIKNLT